jgi:hypothetical protein
MNKTALALRRIIGSIRPALLADQDKPAHDEKAEVTALNSQAC